MEGRNQESDKQERTGSGYVSVVRNDGKVKVKIVWVRKNETIRTL